jgi:hypothetical protein
MLVIAFIMHLFAWPFEGSFALPANMGIELRLAYAAPIAAAMIASSPAPHRST